MDAECSEASLRGQGLPVAEESGAGQRVAQWGHPPPTSGLSCGGARESQNSRFGGGQGWIQGKGKQAAASYPGEGQRDFL